VSLLKTAKRDPCTKEAITWAYRLFLDREPENDGVIVEKAERLRSLRDLRHEFLQSEEFCEKNYYFPTVSPFNEGAGMSIEEVQSEADLQTLFRHIQASWEHLGETEPHWSVLSTSRFLQANLDHSRSEFYQSGKNDMARSISTLRRNGIDPGSLKSCLEYGCGLGRVTRWFAEHFQTVHGFDISSAHLRAAEEYLSGVGLQNVTLRQVRSVEDLADLPRVDMVYSLLVLQHNPPPLIKLLIGALLRALHPGGVAIFQVPTYGNGYRFCLRDYLNARAQKREIEMHVLPQRQVFEIIREQGARVLEVIQDNCAGDTLRSNTFVVQKG
jgi:SAM-dependent methyltransferase